jgi:hypothetical protein
MNISILSGFVWPQGFREVFELVSPEVRWNPDTHVLQHGVCCPLFCYRSFYWDFL